MADDIDETSIIIQDEVTEGARRVRQQFRNFQRNTSFQRVSGELNQASRHFGQVGQEFRSTFEQLGFDAKYTQQGFVNKFAAIAGSLNDLVTKSKALRYSSQNIGLSAKQYLQLQYAMTAKGMSLDEAARSLDAMGRSIKSLGTFGKQSPVYAKFALEGGPMGRNIAAAIQQVWIQRGTYDAIKYVYQRMREAPGDPKNQAWFRQVVMDALGLSSQAAMDSDMSKYGDAIALDDQLAGDFLQQSILLRVQLEQLGARISITLMPQIEKLIEFLIDQFKGPVAGGFRKYLFDLIESFEKINWNAVEEGVVETLRFAGEQLKLFARDLDQVISDIDAFFNKIKAALARDPKEGDTEGQRKFNRYINWLLGGNTGDDKQQFRKDPEFEFPFANILDSKIFEKFSSLLDNPNTPFSTNIEDRRGDAADESLSPAIEAEQQRTRRELQQRFKEMTKEISILTDTLRVRRGGISGGNVEGGVTKAGRNRPMMTVAGESGGPPRAIAGQSRSSWYSQFKGAFGWGDPADKAGSAFTGHPDVMPGIALRAGEGAPGRPGKQEGGWFEVASPNARTFLVRQHDIGPSYTSAHGRQIDINAALAERMGYSPKTFPTDKGVFTWKGRDAPAAGTESGTEVPGLGDPGGLQGAVPSEYVPLPRARPAGSELNLNVNMRGEGATADAAVEGFSNSSVNISRDRREVEAPF